MLGILPLHQAQPSTAPPHGPKTQGPNNSPKAHFSPTLSPSAHHLKSLLEFQKTHAQFIKLGLDHVSCHSAALLSAAALSDWADLDYANSIFLGLDKPTAFHYNTMIRAHTKQSSPISSFLLFQAMLTRAIIPDRFTFTFILKACAQLSAHKEGTQAHGLALKCGFGSDLFIQNSLINFYGKCGRIELARKAFHEMGRHKTVASWSSVLSAHTKMGLWAGCLHLFGEMTRSGLRPDESSLVSALASCARLGALGRGRSAHASLLRNFTGLNTIVQTSLIDMYAKCGQLETGIKLFDRMQARNAWTYSVVISGLAMHGDGEKALEVFDAMLEDGIEPDEAIYVGVLSACSRGGLVEEGLRLFDRMKLEHRIEPSAQHYGCVVDLMGRAGKLDEACKVIEGMPAGMPTDVAWRCLLNYCIYDKLEIAELAVQNLLELNVVTAGDYVVLANMHAKAQQWDMAARVRTRMVDRGLVQGPGVSQVEVRGRMHSFVSQDKSHPQSEEVWEMLHQMEWQLRFEGYRPDTSQVLLDVDEEQKRQLLSGQSQKLALAYGLLSSEPRTSIRIVTNLRMCRDCHTYSRLISQIFEREIIVRDRNRFHRFSHGVCSCRDYW